MRYRVGFTWTTQRNRRQHKTEHGIQLESALCETEYGIMHNTLVVIKRTEKLKDLQYIIRMEC